MRNFNKDEGWLTSCRLRVRAPRRAGEFYYHKGRKGREKNKRGTRCFATLAEARDFISRAEATSEGQTAPPILLDIFLASRYNLDGEQKSISAQ